MIRCYRYRLYPNKEQRIYFAKTFGCVRFIYNKILEDKIAHYKETKEMLNIYPAAYKEAYPWLADVDAKALSYAERHLNTSFQNFFKRPETGFPKYKSKENHRKSYTTSGAIRIENGHLRLPKIGFVKINLHRECKGTIKNATIVQEPSGKYYVSLTTESEEPRKYCRTSKEVDISLDTQNFKISVDGNPLDSPMFLQESERKLKTLQKKLSRCEEGSKNWEKQRRRLARKHEQIANRRAHYINTQTKRLVQKKQIITVEDTGVKQMMQGNSDNAKLLAELSWFEFTRQLEYKAKWYGREYVKNQELIL